jgi:SAM-dependent methyltransferase
MVDRQFADAEIAAWYDQLEATDDRADFDFYLPLLLAADTVLDVGCGTGALLHRARAAGHTGRLCGLDPGEGMLAQARRHPDIEWVLSDLGSVGWEREFDLIVMTGHAFQVLLTDDEVLATLSGARSALTGRGRFVFETRNPVARAWQRWTPDHVQETVDESGGVVRTWHEVDRPIGEFVSFTSVFTGPQWDQPQYSRSTLRFLDIARLGEFLVAAGLAVERRYGDWDEQSFDETSPEIITVARPKKISD